MPCFHFCLFQGIFFFFWFLLWHISYLGVCYFISTYLWISQFSSCYWFLISYHCSQKSYLVWFQPFTFAETVFWSKIWSILETVPCVLEKNIYPAAVGWNVLCMSVRSIWSKVQFKSNVFLLIFCLDELSIWKVGHWSSLLFLYCCLFLPSDMLVFD